MASPLLKTVLARASTRIPGVRALPVMRLIAVAEVGVLARERLARLTPQERRRLGQLIRIGRGRRDNLGSAEQAELQVLVAKLDPKAFAAQVADKLSPVPLPGRRRRSHNR